jgi:hypothetical protein
MGRHKPCSSSSSFFVDFEVDLEEASAPAFSPCKCHQIHKFQSSAAILWPDKNRQNALLSFLFLRRRLRRLPRHPPDRRQHHPLRFPAVAAFAVLDEAKPSGHQGHIIQVNSMLKSINIHQHYKLFTFSFFLSLAFVDFDFLLKPTLLLPV